MSNRLDLLTKKKQQLDAVRPLSPELVKNLDEWFRVELTYNSNAIEGNTLSRAETALVVEKGITIQGKTMREHLEAINHVEALSHIYSLVRKKRTEMTETDILDIHRLVLAKIDDAHAGRYRSVPVRIAGSRAVMPNPIKVPEFMKDFVRWLQTDNSSHPVTIAGEAHYRLVRIHPFIDGNGRTARLLMNLLLMQTEYPLCVIRLKDRSRYVTSLEKAQLGASRDEFFDLMYEAVERSLDIYLNAAKGSIPKDISFS